MKTLKKIGIGLLALIALIVLIGLFLPSAVHVEESGEMTAAPELVYAQIADFKNWPDWSPWHEADSNMVMNYQGEPMQVGHGYSWTSKELGDGRIVFTKMTPHSALASEMYFMGDDKPAYAGYTLEATESGTRMTWSIDFDMGENPFGKVLGAIIFPMMLKKDLKRGLERLKSRVEAMPPKAPALVVTHFTTQPIQYVALKYEGAPGDVNAQLGQMYATLQAYLETEKMEITGAPFAIWHWWSDTLVRFEACLPFGQKIKGTKTILYSEMAATPAIQADYFGPSEQTEATHYALGDYADKKGLKLGSPIEIYVTDAAQEPDTAKWHTQIIYPILP
jgi:effector-binding domain-containing protein